MAIMFRTPDQGLDHYKHVLELITIFQDIFKNPDLPARIAQLSKEVAAAHELPESRKQEAAEAQAIIARSKDFLAELEKAKTEHEKKVSADLKAIEAKNNEYLANLKAFAAEKAATAVQVEKLTRQAEAAVAEAGAIKESARLRHAEADRREGEMKQGEQAQRQSRVELDAAIAALAREKAEFADRMASATAAHAEAVRKLAEDRAAFEVRKKKLDAVLKDNA